MIKEKISKFYGRYVLNVKSGFHLRKPRLLARLGANYTKLLLGEGPLLRCLDIAINWECNLKCEHCFAVALKDPDSPKRLDTPDYIRLVNEARNLGAIHVAFQGGEPLIYPKLEETIEAIDPWSIVVSITTNGTLVNRERISKLYKLGVDQLTLSIDSGEAEDHDSFRGVKGTYAQAIAAVGEILKSPMNLTINTMLTHENIRSEGLKKMLEFVDKNRIKLNVVLPAPIGRWENDTKHIVTEEDKVLVEQILRKFPTVRRDLDANYYTFGCGAAKEVLYVSPEGNLLVCPFIHASLGNVRNTSLKELRARALKHETFSRYHSCCLAAEDRQFIKSHLSRCWEREGKLIDIDDMMKDGSKNE
jgi:MoaA/NifB/PqqE/SkfB family radical SAM enzyme